MLIIQMILLPYFYHTALKAHRNAERVMFDIVSSLGEPGDKKRLESV